MNEHKSNISPEIVCAYIKDLINRFFKILPIKESGEPSLKAYMESLRAELLGCQSLVSWLELEHNYMTLLSILQYLIDHNEECSVKEVRREVFKAISICNKLMSICAERTGE